MRESVTAPHIMKVRDVKAGEDTIRVVDLWFVVYADLDEIDTHEGASRANDKEVEAGNMAVRVHLLSDEERKAAGVEAPSESGQETWFAHIHGRLLDRIAFDVTNRVVATRTHDSVVLASRTDPAFDKAGRSPNGWKAIGKGSGKEAAGSGAYRGGVSYAKISRLAFREGALLVEMHGAFLEPHGWFRGAPILRSKFGVVAQDQIRKLRRELERKSSSN